MKPELERIAKVMERPDEWILTRHELVHNGTGVTFWVANGFLFFHCDAVPLGIVGKVRLWRIAKRLMREVTANRLERMLDHAPEEPAKGAWIQ